MPSNSLNILDLWSRIAEKNNITKNKSAFYRLAESIWRARVSVR